MMWQKHINVVVDVIRVIVAGKERHGLRTVFVEKILILAHPHRHVVLLGPTF